MTSNPLQSVINFVMLIVVILHLIYLQFARSRERLILTPAGIRYRSPFPDLLQGLRPGWQIAWGEIRRITLGNCGNLQKNPQLVWLEFEIANRKVKIFPGRWVDPDHYKPVSPWQSLLRLERPTSRQVSEAVFESEIMRYLAIVLPRLVPKRNLESAHVAFDLVKNVRSLSVAIAFFALVLYAFADAFVFGEETYAGQAPLDIFIGTGAIAAIAALLWMRRGKVPLVESAMMALLLGVAVGAASYPGALRVNALTDQSGLRTYTYRLTSSGEFQPLTSGLPAFSLRRYSDYWARFRSGSLHQFELRKGGLGFYQINVRPLNEAMRGVGG